IDFLLPSAARMGIPAGLFISWSEAYSSYAARHRRGVFPKLLFRVANGSGVQGLSRLAPGSDEPGELPLLVAQVLEQQGGDVALAEVRQDRDDGLVLVLRLLCLLLRSPDGCTVGETSQDVHGDRALA